jgi:hypothetical protein
LATWDEMEMEMDMGVTYRLPRAFFKRRKFISLPDANPRPAHLVLCRTIVCLVYSCLRERNRVALDESKFVRPCEHDRGVGHHRTGA